MFALKAAVEAGGLMRYGPNYDYFFEHAATYVDKILRGANPGELPVEQASKFELAINPKASCSYHSVPYSEEPARPAEC